MAPPQHKSHSQLSLTPAHCPHGLGLTTVPRNPAENAQMPFPKSFSFGTDAFPERRRWAGKLFSTSRELSSCPWQAFLGSISVGNLSLCCSSTACRSEAPVTIPRRRGDKGRKCLSEYRTGTPTSLLFQATSAIVCSKMNKYFPKHTWTGNEDLILQDY